MVYFNLNANVNLNCGHTDSTEILGFKFQDSSFRSRRKRRERRNTYGSGFRIKVSSLSEHESHELNEYCLQND